MNKETKTKRKALLCMGEVYHNTPGFQGKKVSRIPCMCMQECSLEEDFPFMWTRLFERQLTVVFWKGGFCNYFSVTVKGKLLNFYVRSV